MMLRATPVLPGWASGALMKLPASISFWGGVDPRTGTITDPSCPQVGRCVTNTILVLPSTRGSSSGSAVMLQLLHAGLAPAAIILGEVDAILGLGILVASEMGWPTIPLLTLDVAAQARLIDGAMTTIEADGMLRDAS